MKQYIKSSTNAYELDIDEKVAVKNQARNYIYDISDSVKERYAQFKPEMFKGIEIVDENTIKVNWTFSYKNKIWDASFNLVANQDSETRFVLESRLHEVNSIIDELKEYNLANQTKPKQIYNW